MERAILVGIRTDGQDAAAFDDALVELHRLAETAGAEVVYTVTQKRHQPDPAWYMGRGKAEEVARLAEEAEADLVIVDQELSPAQVRNLEAVIPCKVIDRTQLILDIFAQRARTKEGKLQVELAQLRYLLPRLAGKGRELSRLGGGIGTRGPGETKLEVDRRRIRRRIADLEDELAEVVRHRVLLRERRRRGGVFRVALVGYTNAGKSTLLNRLTRANVLAEDKLFATLDPTVRRLKLPSGHDAVLIDTVGFIQNLPTHLVAAFRATLEEVCDADLLLHVVDASHPNADRHIAVVRQVLADIGAAHLPELLVWNKIDLLPPHARLFVDHPDEIAISAYSDRDLERLWQRIDALRQRDFVTVRLRVPVSAGRLLASIHEHAVVRRWQLDESGSAYTLEASMDRQTARRLAQSGIFVHILDVEGNQHD